MVSASDVADTLRYLVPGFIAIRVFYWFGLKTKRTDLELTIWSVIIAAPIDRIVESASLTSGDTKLSLAIFTGVALGAAASVVWQMVVFRWPRWSVESSGTAWDAALSGAMWVNVWLDSGDIWFGYPAVVALSVETDNLDLRLLEPALVDPDSGERHPKVGTDSLVIARDKIRMVEILAPAPASPPSTPRAQVDSHANAH